MSSEDVFAGIGHTRWATHGAPSDENSHPHLSDSGKIAVVHNGIIENYLELKKYLTDKGYKFHSETDTEVIAHLVEHHYKKCEPGNLLEAVRMTLSVLEGSYALGVLCADCPESFVAARKDSPLIIGLGEQGNYIASDIPAILSRTRNIVIMEDQEIALLTAECVKLFDSLGQPVEREPVYVTWDSEAAEKGGYEHFMMKEINEEARALKDTIVPRIRNGLIRFEHVDLNREILEDTDHIHIVACGTASHAGVVGKYIMKKTLPNSSAGGRRF
jgi:glucosamine--fructose-6-phosphate aminotransferase (isomerizing)